MKIKLNWALFLLAAASYVAYPVWNLPAAWPVRLLLLNFFVLLAAAALYSPLVDAELEPSAAELKELWPAVLLAAAACLPLWLTPIACAYDEQSHAGPAAWALGRLAGAAGLDVRLLPLFFLPAAALLAWGAVKIYKKGLSLPGRGTAVLLLAAAGNLWFLADLRWDLADAVGRYQTVLRYPPLSKFLYLPAYALLGINEAAPRLVQFAFVSMTAVYLLRLLRDLKADPPPRLTYLLIVLFPSFFNLSLSAELEGGTVFFFAAALYHFIAAARTGERGQFLKCAFWLAAGFFYKQLLLGLLLSLLPALLALRLLAPERRADWLFGLKTLAIPALLGLPFIVISAVLGVRSTALEPAYLLDPGTMLMNFRNLWQTSGTALTALLTLAAAWALWRRRSPGLWLLLYAALAYHVMISASHAVGYIRHAQPFYLAPVFLLVLAFSGLYAALPRAAGRAAGALLLALLAWQSLFAPAPYQRKTLKTSHLDALPYPEAVDYLKALGRPGLRVYAPMELEPSHFYLAKAGLAGKITWERALPAGFGPSEAAAGVRSFNPDFVLLPYSSFSWMGSDFKGAADALLSSGRFIEEKVFEYRGNKLILLKPVFL